MVLAPPFFFSYDMVVNKMSPRKTLLIIGFALFQRGWTRGLIYKNFKLVLIADESPL